MNKTKIAVFDIDGTLFRSSLMLELFYALIREKIFDESVLATIEKHYVTWKNRKGTYAEYIASVVCVFDTQIKGKQACDVRRLSRDIVKAHKNRVYVYTRDLVETLRRDHILIAISGSPIEMIKEFNRYWKFDYIIGGVHEIKAGTYTGNVLFDPTTDKKAILNEMLKNEGLSLKGSVGVGDTEMDISFLELVAKPICFNPNKKLYEVARKKKWAVVVERKDVVYKGV